MHLTSNPLADRLSRRSVLLATAAATAAAVSPDASAAAEEPERFVAGLGERAFRTLREAGGDAREREVAALLDEAVDLPQLARLVLGRHWRAATEPQRAEYLTLFRAYALQGLTSALSQYTGRERFAVTGTRPAGDQDLLVGTELAAQSGGPSTRIDWRVQGAEGGRFAVVDVVVEGVSLLVTNRAEFDSIVTRGGIDGLLREMRGWYEEGASGRSRDDA